MYSVSELNKWMFFDIETIPMYKTLEELEAFNSRLHYNWINKVAKAHQSDVLSQQDIWFNNAALYPEYAKIVAVSFGKILYNSLDNSFIEYKTVNVYDNNEKSLLEKCYSKFNTDKDIILAGFNIIDFDIPFLCKKYLYHGISLPKHLNVRGLKPWDIKMADIMKDLSFTSNKKTSLERIAISLNVKTPKNGPVDGEHLAEYYYLNGISSLPIISEYCEKDIIATMEVSRKLSNEFLTKPTT